LKKRTVFDHTAPQRSQTTSPGCGAFLHLRGMCLRFAQSHHLPGALCPRPHRSRIILLLLSELFPWWTWFCFQINFNAKPSKILKETLCVVRGGKSQWTFRLTWLPVVETMETFFNSGYLREITIEISTAPGLRWGSVKYFDGPHRRVGPPVELRFPI